MTLIEAAATHRNGANEMTTETTTHRHDLGITISAAEVPADLMPYLRAGLRQAIESAIEDWTKDSDLDIDDDMLARLGAISIDAFVSYDGSRECGEH